MDNPDKPRTAPRPPRPPHPLATLSEFAPYLWQEYPRRVVVAVALLILERCIAVYIPLLYGDAVDVVARDNFVIAALLISVGAYVAARLLRQIFNEMQRYVFAKVAQSAIRRLALKTFHHLHKMPMAFHINRQTGGLSRVIERGVKSIEFLLTFTLFNIVPTLLEIILVCAVFWWLFSWHYAAIALATVAIYVVFTIVTTEWRNRFRQIMNTEDKRAGAFSVDSLLNYETVKYFNAENFEAAQYDGAMKGYEAAAIKSRTTLSLLNIGQGVIISVGMLLILILTGIEVGEGRANIGLFASVNLYIMQLYMPLNFLGEVYRQLRQALTDMEEMFALLRQAPEIADAAGAKVLRVGDGELTFENVTFQYGGRAPVLRDLSFTVGGGRTLAVVGASGSGKTTITRLLYRFYEPSGGRILIDGQDIRTVTMESLRRPIGVVPQDTVLFNNTLRYNLLYGDPDANEAQMRQAVADADIADFIAALPQGFATTVGERGLKLSGGEKQRVAIARVLLKKPKLFVFDEATSALDSETERHIQDALNRISERHTTLIIAHRLSTVVHADEIIVLSDGRIAERGRHAELIARGGIYRHLWDNQASSD